MMISTSLKIISLKATNIEGMTTDLKFDSNIIVLYGYNRAGKTILVKTIKHAFKGIRGISDLKKVLGLSQEGKIELIFEFRGVLYMIIRNLTQTKEHLTFKKSKLKAKEIEKLPPAKKKMAWSGQNIEELIPKTEIKLSGTNKNISLFSDTLHELKLYPEIIDRLIAIENTQEFKKAVQSFASERGGGYEHIKQLLYEDLKEKDDAIGNILIYSETTIKNLERYDSLIVDDYRSLMNDIKAYIDIDKLNNFEVGYFNQSIELLKLDSDYNENLKNFKEELKNKQTVIENSKKKAESLQNTLQRKEDKYITLENLLETINLKDLEVIIDKFRNDKNIIDSIMQNLRQIQLEIAENPKKGEIQDISINFNYLSEKPILEILKNANLDDLDNLKEINNIPLELNKIIKNFNKALTIYSRNKEFLTKYQITSNQIEDKIEDYTNQLKQFKEPTLFNKTDEIFEIKGRIEEQDSGKVLKLYMSKNKLIEYIECKNPLRVSKYLFPLLTSKDDKIPEDVMKRLTHEIDQFISELEELKELQTSIKNSEETLKKGINVLADISTIISHINEIVGQWNDHIIGEKKLALDFIEKYLKVSKKKKNTFGTIETNLKQIEKDFKNELSSDLKEMQQEYDNSSSLIINLNNFSAFLTDFIKFSNDIINVIKEFLDFTSENQEIYKKICKDKELNGNLKDTVLPTIRVICEQIRSNIHLDLMEENIMKQIINIAQLFYSNITKENHLLFQKLKVDDNIYLKPFIRKSDGTLIPILDTGPSGSEQAAIALGIMVALARLFHAFVVIDEVTERFDFNTKLRFLSTIGEHSKDLFWIIVLLVNTSKEGIPDELQRIKNAFPNSNIYQPIKDDSSLTLSVKRVRDFKDFEIKEES